MSRDQVAQERGELGKGLRAPSYGYEYRHRLAIESHGPQTTAEFAAITWPFEVIQIACLLFRPAPLTYAKKLQVPPWRIGERFSGRVVIDASNATEIATQAEYALPSHDRIVYWTDGSFLHNFPWTGSAIVWKDLEVPITYRWKAKGFAVLHEAARSPSSFAAEAVAIFKALEILEEQLTSGRVNPGARACILSDSQDVLNHIRDFPRECQEDYRNMCQAIVTKANALTRNSSVSIVFFWCPGHIGVDGNELANEVARSAPMFADPMLLVHRTRSAALARRERELVEEAKEKARQRKVQRDEEERQREERRNEEERQRRERRNEEERQRREQRNEERQKKKRRNERRNKRREVKSILRGEALEDIRSRWSRMKDLIESSTAKEKSPIASITGETDTIDSLSEDVTTSEEEDTLLETDSGLDVSSDKDGDVSKDADKKLATISQTKVDNTATYMNPTDGDSIPMDISSDEGN
ncbi:MAG: hypothetical protein Q9157_007418 [Trypethelium eluteriae]